MAVVNACELLGRHDFDDNSKCRRCEITRIMLEFPSEGDDPLAGMWVVRREQGPCERWCWWLPKASSYCAELIHAGLYSEAEAKRHQRLRIHDDPAQGYDHKAYPLAEALGIVRAGTVGAYLGLAVKGDKSG